MLPSRYAIIARCAVSVPVRSAVGFVSSVVALEFSVESPPGDSQQAWEQPELFAAQLRTAFRSLREAH
jgi:hypothetical protein